MPDGDARRPRDVYPLGIHRYAALFHPAAVPHESRTARTRSEYYGSNSYWPNSLFYARPIPDQPTQGGGRDLRPSRRPRMGELMVFDPARARRGRRGRAADPRLRQEGRADHQGPTGRRLLAEVPAPLSAERQVFPGVVQARRRSRPGAFTWSTCSTTCCCWRKTPGYALLGAGAASARRPRRR